jgi:hypothetical protein
VGLALVIATLPLIVYYSSLLYLELPAVFLMMAVCVSAEKLLTLPAAELRREASWYALILLGFIKETVAPFLLAFLLVRYAARCSEVLRTREWRRAILDEMKVGVSVLLPLAAYLMYRMLFASTRGFEPHPANLVDWNLYGVLARSYAQQFGPILLLTAAGFALLAAQHRRVTIAFFVAALAAQISLHLMDYEGYVGYSRFNLFAAPMLLVPACAAMDWIARRSRGATELLLVGLLAANVWLCPIEPDGSRKAGWGDSEPRHSVTDWSYPFRDACRYVSAHYAGQGAAFVFEGFSYRVGYYMDSRVRFDIVIGAEELTKFFETPASRRPGAVVYHLRRVPLPKEFAAHGYEVEKVFENDAGNKLLLLTRRRLQNANE